MTKAVVMPFFRYQPRHGEYYRVFFDQLLKGLAIWGDEFDHLYINDQAMEFTGEDLEKLVAIKPKTTIIKAADQNGGHWTQLKHSVRHIKEDAILFMDQDVLIWKKGIIADWFKKAESADIVTAFDGSGGMRDPIWERFKVLKDNDAVRMGSYYFVLHRSTFEEMPDFDFTPVTYDIGTGIPELNYTTKDGDWSDSFGLFTIKFLGAKERKVAVIDDDRSSIWLDGENPVKPKQLGYYHIRNGNFPVYALTSKMYGHEDDYRRVLKEVPLPEFVRLFGWFYVMSKYKGEVISVMQDRGITPGIWEEYIRKFREYHVYYYD